ncbi:YozE family protein [Planococcus sp. X10-3]|uniref:YozE family protein n=1 Tax=Planococcus sp. X10-3 TaxID=3061240 RepID=UPI003BB20DC6
MLTFKQWLLKFNEVDLPIGDAAREVAADPNFPETKSYKEIFNYLEDARASDGWMRTYKEAFKFYSDTTQ